MTLRSLILAFRFLTRLPMPAVADVGDGDLARASVFFPLVGMVIGAILAALMWIFAPAGMWLAAACAVIGWVWVTGALHLDGLGDVADALGAAHAQPERFLKVLKDPHAGNFAIVAIHLQLMAKLVLLAHLTVPGALAALVIIPAWARWGALAWRHMLSPLQPGLGQDFSRAHSTPAVVLWALVLMAASLLFAPSLLVALAVIPAIGLYWRWRHGGMTGDCLGASVEVAEALLLAAVVAR